ncbi:MAG: ABC transporter substrate-binding protein [Candidatus Flemingiibacterium sp.]
MKKLFIMLVLAIAVLAIACSCKDNSAERVTNVFRSEEIELPEGFSPDRLFIIDSGYALLEIDNSELRTRLVKVEKTGSAYRIASDEIIEDYVRCAFFLPDGDLVYISQNSICRRGSTNITIPESDLAGRDKFVFIAADSSRNIVFGTQEMIIVTDPELSKLFSLDTAGTINQIRAGTDGMIYLDTSSRQTGQECLLLNISSQKFEKLALPDGIKSMTFLNGGDGLLWFKNQIGLYTCTADSETLVCDFLNSDLSVNKLTSIIPEDTEHLAAIYDQKLLVLTHVPNSKVEPRTLIKVAGTKMPDYMLDEAAAFNRRSSEYRVVVNDYSIYEDPDAQLRNDIISGKLPDIMIFGQNEKYHEEYINQKMFADLWSLMDADQSFDKSDLITGALKCGERDGKLYELPTFFFMSSLLIKTSNAQSDGWTLREFLDWAKSLDGAAAILKSPSELLYMLLRCSMEEFVDYQNGKCSFDSELFRETLEFAKNYHPDVEDFLTDDELEKYSESSIYASACGKLMLADAWYDMPGGFFRRYLRAFNFDEITAIGYPDSDGNGVSLTPLTSFAIVEKSGVKTAAWEFIKGMLPRLSEFTWGEFTCSRSAMRKIYENLYGTIYAIDYSKGSAYSYTREQLEADPPDPEKYYIYEYSKADCEKMISLLDGADTSLRSDSTLWSIIIEDAEMYFADAKTLDETVRIIQDRAENYIAEQN